MPRPGDEAAPSGRGNVKPNQRGIAQSRVPDHVQHPERYTLYTLDEPLVVGGGVAQLGSESHKQMEQVRPAASPHSAGPCTACTWASRVCVLRAGSIECASWRGCSAAS
jgi:hypothetical protein